MEGSQKQGMSKGCLVAIIIAAVILVIIIIGGIVCYSYKDSIVKTGMVTIVGEMKSKVGENPPEGVDTVQFNAVSDAFTDKLNEADVDFKKLGVKIQELQTIATKATLDSDDVDQFENAMVDMFPDLEEVRLEHMEEQVEEDTVGAETDSM